MLVSLKKELEKAEKNNYAVPAFNFDNMEMMKAIIEAAEEEKSPVILMVTESAAIYMGLDYVFKLSVEAANKSTTNVVVHWDHGFDIDLIKKAVDAGFSSVMLDSSKKPFNENVSETLEIVKYAHEHGVDVESEIGHVGGKEDDRTSENGGYTTVEEAVDFENQTKIDALAIAVGTAHGVYKGKPELQFDLMKKIKSATKTPLVLHGSSGVPLDDLKKAIEIGICKINIGTDLKIAYADALKEWFISNPGQYDARKFGRFGIDKVKKICKEKIIAFNSQKKAV